MDRAASRGEELPMATDDPIRASDADREAVVATLREAFTDGRLTLDEFDERMAAAYAGRTWGDLRGLTADLPVQPVLGADIPERELSSPAALSATAPSTAADLEPGQEPGPSRGRRRGGGPSPSSSRWPSGRSWCCTAPSGPASCSCSSPCSRWSRSWAPSAAADWPEPLSGAAG